MPDLGAGLAGRVGVRVGSENRVHEAVKALVEAIGIYSGARPRHGKAKPSLLHALQANLADLDDVMFGWCDGHASLGTDVVRAAARDRNMPLPKGWTFYESEATRGLAERIRRACKQRPYVEFPASTDSGGLLREFEENAKKARSFLDCFTVEGCVVSVFGEPGAVTPFDLSSDRAPLANILTRGLRCCSASVRRELSGAEGLIPPKFLRQLFALGNSSS